MLAVKRGEVPQPMAGAVRKWSPELPIRLHRRLGVHAVSAQPPAPNTARGQVQSVSLFRTKREARAARRFAHQRVFTAPDQLEQHEGTGRQGAEPATVADCAVRSFRRTTDGRRPGQ